jgi:hypothetical protein
MNQGCQQIMPENRETAAVSGMSVGEVGYIVSWGMWVDASRRCWLHPDYAVREAPGGTANMRIERRADGYHVWAPLGATWNPKKEPTYASPADTAYISVTEVHDLHRAS